MGNGWRSWNIHVISSPHPDLMLSNSLSTMLVSEGERGPTLLADSPFSSAGPEYAYVAAEPSGMAVC